MHDATTTTKLSIAELAGKARESFPDEELREMAGEDAVTLRNIVEKIGTLCERNSWPVVVFAIAPGKTSYSTVGLTRCDESEVETALLKRTGRHGSILRALHYTLSAR